MFDVITFGSATLDIFLKDFPYQISSSNKFPTKRGLCFSLGSKISVGEMISTSGGGAVNTAITFARQGLKTGAVFSIGRDKTSQQILEQLKEEKIDCSLATIKKDFKTPTSVIISLKSGERTILHIKRRHALDPLVVKKIYQTKWIYLAPFIGEGTELKDKNFLLSLLKQAKKNKIFLASNPSLFDLKLYKKHPSLLNYFDVFILNQEEASLLTGIPYQKTKDIFRKLDELVEGIVVMTRGNKGVIVSNGYWLWRAGTFKEKEAVDRTGAGDGFGAAFVAGLIKTQKKDPRCLARKKLCPPDLIKESIRLASANATSIVEHLGANTGALKLRDFLKEKRWQKLDIKVKKL